MNDHNIRRYEAFSDVVIGFSLAQTGSILAVPAHGIDLIANPTWLFVFLWTFANICALWWFHHRLFTTVWRPRPIQILLNFALLAAIVLVAYTTGLFAHVADIWLFRLYYVPYTVAYALMTWMCLNARSDWESNPKIMIGVSRGIAINLTWTVVFAVVALWWYMPLPLEILGTWTWVPFTVGVILSATFGRHYRKREAALG